MVGLIDIAPRVETVDVQGASVAVHGTAKGVAHVLGRFPELRMLMTGHEVEATQLMAMGGDAVAAIISAGCGYPGDEKAETVAGRLSIDVQADLLAAILRLTLPVGLGPFVEKLTGLGSILDAAPSVSGPGATQNIRNVSLGKFDPVQIPGAGQIIFSAFNRPGFHRTGLLPVQIVWFDRPRYLKRRPLKYTFRSHEPGGLLLQPAPKSDDTVGDSPADIGLRLLLRATPRAGPEAARASG